jgi:hypothetical protein
MGSVQAAALCQIKYNVTTIKIHIKARRHQATNVCPGARSCGPCPNLRGSAGEG